jgi:hypothetical protein
MIVAQHATAVKGASGATRHFFESMPIAAPEMAL